MSDSDKTADSPPGPTKTRSNRRKKWVVAVLIAATAVALAVGIPIYLHHRHTHVSTDDAFVDGYIYDVSTRIPGEVATLAVDDNQPVEAGQVLLTLDARDLETNVRIAQYKLAAAQNRVAALVESARAAKAHAAALKAQASYATKEKQRVTLLARADAVPRAQFDESYMRWQSASEQVAAATRQRREILASLGPRGPHGELADIELARAALAKAELELGYATVRSPVRGIVTRKQVQVGEVVAPAQPLLAVVPLQDVFITANYKETDLTYVRPGQAVTIAVDTYPDARLRGRVDSIMSGTGAAFSLIPPENATGNFVKVVQRIPVKIALVRRDGDPILRIGMSVEPTILVEQP